jgi:hypothetical protein
VSGNESQLDRIERKLDELVHPTTGIHAKLDGHASDDLVKFRTVIIALLVLTGSVHAPTVAKALVQLLGG